MAGHKKKLPSRWWTRECNALRDYVQRHEARGIPAESRGDIAAYAAGTVNVGSATVALADLANYRSAVGCLRVLDGDADGHLEIDLACLYSYWRIRLLVRAHELDTRVDKQPRVFMDAVATCWVHAQALGALQLLDSLSTLVAATAASDTGSVGGKGMNPLCTLVAHFVTQGTATELRRAGWAPLGPYASVVDSALRAESYYGLAEYHASRVDVSDYPEYFFYPYRIVPFELIAIEKRTSVAIVGSSHPLLTSPLFRRRQVESVPMTDELKAVLNRAKDELGSLDN